MTNKIRIMGIGSTILVSLLFLVFFAMLTSGYSQEEMTQVENDSFENPQRPPTVFNHEAHNETAEIEDCARCHHLYEDGELVEGESSEDMRCAECHKEHTTTEAPGLMQAFHQNCKGCHEDNKSGPVMCGECHRR